MTDKSKNNNTGKPQRGTGQDGSSKGVKKGKSIPIGDSVQGNTTTTSTGPRGPKNEKK
jgi:hypothetical protein